MTATTPEEFHRTWAERLNAGDLDSLMELYEPGAVMVGERGRVEEGEDAIRGALVRVAYGGTQFDLTFQKALQRGDTALLYSRWTMVLRDPLGGEIHVEGQTTDVVRRQPDGTWRFIIQNAFGGQAIDTFG
jgi:uncharacterized protein (TIGR02246 family)